MIHVLFSAKRTCYANPCLNGGKCMEENYRYPCVCPHGYKPPYCRGKEYESTKKILNFYEIVSI